ncbi:hypothetical protein MBLNU230_g2965t1 [Neophaeotheca triangularis]
MAAGGPPRPCTVELHDARVSREGVLCGSKALPPGNVAYLSSSGARPLLVLANHAAPMENTISIHQGLAALFGFENRTEAKLEPIEDHRAVTAAHMELCFKDQYLSRADMWQIIRQLDSTVAYCGQPVQFLGSTAATVRTLYIGGVEVDSALVSTSITKPIFRSESARYTVLIEVSKEMLEYWRGGDLLYERCIGFLTDLFHRWEILKARHTVSLVMHGRRLSDYDQQDINEPCRFCEVVSIDVPSTQWRSLLRTVKATFNNFSLPRDVTLAAQSNTLETIYLAALDFATQHVDDPRLDFTGSSIIAVTAGAGLLEADFETLKQTTEVLMGNGIGVDLVSLSPRPLHPVPLLQYEEDRETKFALPHWLDISYWEGSDCANQSAFLFQDNDPLFKDLALPLLTPEYTTLREDLLNDTATAFDDSLFEPSAPPTRVEEVSSNSSQPEARLFKQNPFEAIDEDGQIIKKLSVQGPISPFGSPDLPKRTPKSETLSRPSIHSDRKISLGPRGLAPGKGVASTTISVEHAGHGKEASTAAKSTDQTSSFLAKHIRDSLRKKPSSFSLSSETSGTERKSTEETAPLPVGKATASDETSDQISKDSKQRQSCNSSTTDHMASSATPKAPFHGFLEDATPSADTVADESALWLTLLNPCNVRRNNIHLASRYRKWQHVFPKAIRPNEFKWASMCAPASLPLTSEHFPTVAELRRKYRHHRHHVKATKEHEAADGEQLINQLTAMRLGHGFQLAASRSHITNETIKETIESTLMSLGDQFHELAITSENHVGVAQYHPRRKAGNTEGPDIEETPSFDVAMHHASDDKPRICKVQLFVPTRSADWEAIDHSLAGEDPQVADVFSHRLRLVLIPVDANHSTAGGWRWKDLTEEEKPEKRIDGIQKLTQLWQRNRLVSTEDAQHQASLSQPKGAKPATDRDPNPLAIEYQTKDPSAVINAYGPDLPGPHGSLDASVHLFPESERYHSSNFDVARLVKQMQEPPPNGVELKDRRWFTRLHLRCFRGDEMTNWLLRVFKDLTFRDDAVRLGNDLMERGIFTHVRKKHEFRDGNYFYQIAGIHRTTDYPDTANFFAKGMGWSVPVTPTTETRNSPFARPISHVSSESESSSNQTPFTVIHAKQQLQLTQVMRNNLDPANKSNRPQIVNLHYDRIHNPENCYHIYLDWLSTTPKLVREGIVRWTSLVESYGLKLVQVPLMEASRQQEAHPFTNPSYIKLAIPPPQKIPATPHMQPNQPPQSPPRTSNDRFAYQKALLRKLDFALDLEAADSFTPALEINYAWSKPDYQYTQYIHKSGLMLAQILNNDDRADFLLLPNRLAPRPNTTNSKTTSNTTPSPPTPEDIVHTVRTLCHDKEALRTFYEEASKPKIPAPSPFNPPTARLDSAADADIPPMQLPPHLAHRGVLGEIG